MKKSKKIILIVLLSLVVSLGIAYIVLYSIYPAKTQEITWQTFDYICNKPLPVIGITTLTLAFVVLAIIKYAAKLKTKKEDLLQLKIDGLEEKLKQSSEYAEILKKQLFELISATETKISQVDNRVHKLYETIPNKKVNNLGEQFYGDSKTETKEI